MLKKLHKLPKAREKGLPARGVVIGFGFLHFSLAQISGVSHCLSRVNSITKLLYIQFSSPSKGQVALCLGRRQRSTIPSRFVLRFRAAFSKQGRSKSICGSLEMKLF